MQGLGEYYCSQCSQLLTQWRSHPSGAPCKCDWFANFHLTLAEYHWGHTQPAQTYCWHEQPCCLSGFLGKVSQYTKKILETTLSGGGKGEGRWGRQLTQCVNEAASFLDRLLAIMLANLIQILFTPWIIQQMNLTPKPLAADQSGITSSVKRIKCAFIFCKTKMSICFSLLLIFACK